MLTVLDEYTREALSVTVATKMGSAEVLDALYPLLIKRGKPEYVRSDNGPEFTSSTFKEWLVCVGVQPIQIYPGSPPLGGASLACRAAHGRTATAKASMPGSRMSF